VGSVKGIYRAGIRVRLKPGERLGAPWSRTGIEWTGADAVALGNQLTDLVLARIQSAMARQDRLTLLRRLVQEVDLCAKMRFAATKPEELARTRLRFNAAFDMVEHAVRWSSPASAYADSEIRDVEGFVGLAGEARALRIYTSLAEARLARLVVRAIGKQTMQVEVEPIDGSDVLNYDIELDLHTTGTSGAEPEWLTMRAFLEHQVDSHIERPSWIASIDDACFAYLGCSFSMFYQVLLTVSGQHFNRDGLLTISRNLLLDALLNSGARWFRTKFPLMEANIAINLLSLDPQHIPEVYSAGSGNRQIFVSSHRPLVVANSEELLTGKNWLLATALSYLNHVYTGTWPNRLPEDSQLARALWRRRSRARPRGETEPAVTGIMEAAFGTRHVRSNVEPHMGPKMLGVTIRREIDCVAADAVHKRLWVVSVKDEAHAVSVSRMRSSAHEYRDSAKSYIGALREMVGDIAADPDRVASVLGCTGSGWIVQGLFVTAVPVPAASEGCILEFPAVTVLGLSAFLANLAKPKRADQ
jgi:hypothetical protein